MAHARMEPMTPPRDARVQRTKFSRNGKGEEPYDVFCGMLILWDAFTPCLIEDAGVSQVSSKRLGSSLE